MDRNELKSWLRGRNKTWRWNQGEYGEYDAVEASSSSLTWYRWSHDIASGGKTEIVEQSFAAFRSDGPAKAVPRSVLELLSDWVDKEQSNVTTLRGR